MSTSFYLYHISACIFQCDFHSYSDIAHFQVSFEMIVPQQIGQNDFHFNISVLHANAIPRSQTEWRVCMWITIFHLIRTEPIWIKVVGIFSPDIFAPMHRVQVHKYCGVRRNRQIVPNFCIFCAPSRHICENWIQPSKNRKFVGIKKRLFCFELS